jgi:hypothetical protein
VNYFKTNVSFAEFEADADTPEPCAASSATSGSIPFEEATNRVAAQDITRLESDPKRWVPVANAVMMFLFRDMPTPADS